MVNAVVDRGNGGPREWRTSGMADLNRMTVSGFLTDEARTNSIWEAWRMRKIVAHFVPFTLIGFSFGV